MVPLGTILLWSLIGLIVLVLFIVFLIALRLALPFPKVTAGRRRLSEITFRSGDILAVEYNTLNGYLSSTITQCEFNHVGLVCLEGGVPFVLEIASYKRLPSGLKYKGGVKVPLDLWLALNRRHRFIYLPLEGPEIEGTRLLEAFEYLGRPMDWCSARWFRFFYSRRYRREHLGPITCMEACIKTLQRVGVYTTEFEASAYWIQQIITRQIPTVDPYHYGSPVEVEVDESANALDFWL